MKSGSKRAKPSVAAAAAVKPNLPPQRPASAGRTVLQQFQPTLPAVCFFLVYYLCLWKWIDVELIYHGGGLVKDFPTFYWGWGFAREFRTRPGGIVEYGSAFLAQSLYSSWFGALVLMLQAAITYACIASLLRSFGLKKLRWLAFVPPLLVLAIYSKYRHYSGPLTSFAGGVVCLWAWVRFTVRRPRWRLWACLAVEACLYAAAPCALVAFVPIAALVQFFSMVGTPPIGLPDSQGTQEAVQSVSVPLWQSLVCLGLSILIPPIVGRVLFGFAPGEAYAKLLPMAWDPIALGMIAMSMVIMLYLLAPLFCLVAMLWRFGAPKPQANQPPPGLSYPLKGSAASVSKQVRRGDFSTVKHREQSWVRRIAWWRWESAGAGLLPIAVVWLAFISQPKAYLLADYLAWNGRWPEVPAAARANPGNQIVACVLAQASYHNGTLTQELPMLGAPADLLLFDEKQQSHWRKSDLYYDLGFLNMALHHLTESVEFYGERPVLLRRLALVNLALGNFSTAKVYLLTLARAPFQSRWAREYLERMRTDQTMAQDEEVRRLRRLMAKRDSVVVLSADEQLLMLLSANRQNRMAFEYLMTYYLLTKNLNAFAKNLSRVKDFAGFEISPLWDEALLLAARQSGHPVEVAGHAISQEATARFAAVTQLVQQYARSRALPSPDLAANYVHTYSFYWCFER